MKKALIALLSLAVAGVLVAQDAPSLKFSGSLQTGMVYAGGDDIDPLVWNNAEDAGEDAYRLRLQGLYENGDAGLKFRLSSAAESKVGVDFAWGWVNLFDNQVLVSSGYMIDNDSWRTKGDGEFDYEASGVKVEVKAVEGLNFGGALFLADAEAGAVELADARYVFGFAYAADVFGVQAGVDYSVGDLQSLYAGVDYTGLENLTLAAEVKVDGAYEYAELGRTTLVQTVTYAKDALEAGIKAYEFTYGGDTEIDMGFKVTPWAAYTMGMNTFKVEVTYNADEYDIDEFATLIASMGADDEYSTLTFKPTVTTKFTDKAKLVTGLEYISMTDMAVDSAYAFFLNFIFEF